MMRIAVHEMLLGRLDDAAQTITLFPAWPKGWDVDFKLKGPLNTTVEAACVGGELTKLVVTPAARKAHIKVINCEQTVAWKTDDDVIGLGLSQLQPPPPAPSVFTVTFFTDVKAGGSGDIPVTVTRSWAPLGADRFYAAVQAGFYNSSAFFRVVAPNSTGCDLTCGGIVQFGISGSKAMNAKWLHSLIKDDPVTQSNTAGIINYADAGPNTRSTELVFMLGDNTNQDAKGFVPFGRIATKDGLAVARAIFNPTPNNTGGIDQGKYAADGNGWINRTYPGVNFIVAAAVAEQ